MAYTHTLFLCEEFLTPPLTPQASWSPSHRHLGLNRSYVKNLSGARHGMYICTNVIEIDNSRMYFLVKQKQNPRFFINRFDIILTK